MTTWMASFLKKNKIQWNNTLLLNFNCYIYLNLINCQDRNWNMWDCCSGRKWPVLCTHFSKAWYYSKSFHCEQALCQAWSSLLVWLDDALSKFLNWIKLKKPCLLITPNAKGFDVKHLFKVLTSCGKFEIALGFSDTLPALKEQHAGRKSFT